MNYKQFMQKKHKHILMSSNTSIEITISGKGQLDWKLKKNIEVFGNDIFR